MSYRGFFVALVFAQVAAIGCGSDPSKPTDEDPVGTQNNTNSQTNSTNATNNGGTNSTNTNSVNATNNVNNTNSDPGDPNANVPSQITSAGAEFTGELSPSGDIVVKLIASQGDRVVIRLADSAGDSWDPKLVLYRATEASPITYADPNGNADAVIPWREADLSTGFEFWYTETYDLVLENNSNVAGPFKFTLECLAGPCKSATGDLDSDGIDDEQDNCPYLPNPEQDNLCAPGVDPWPGKSNASLESSLREAKDDVHVSLDYRDAREYLFGTLDNVDGAVECVYTGTKVETLGIPDTTVMNTEHTWPQSRGGDGAAKADMHHLFPVTAGANIQRNNLFFDRVTSTTWSEGGSRRGTNASGDTRFEPRDSHKGDAARALFYVAVMYNLSMDSDEESRMREWHEQDPVDDTERRRNQGIANFQNSRNPFVDYPHLVERISDF